MLDDQTVFGLALIAAFVVAIYIVWALALLPLFVAGEAGAPCAWCSRVRSRILEVTGYFIGLRTEPVTRPRYATGLQSLFWLTHYCLVFCGALFLAIVALLFFALPWSAAVSDSLFFAFIGLTLAFCWVTYRYWRLDGDARKNEVEKNALVLRSPHLGEEGYNPELSVTVGLLVYVGLVILIWIHPGDLPGIALYITKTLVSALPFNEQMQTFLARIGIDLNGAAEVGPFVDAVWHQFLVGVIKVIALLAAITFALNAARLINGDQRRVFERRLSSWIQASAQAHGRSVANTSDYVHAALEQGEDYAFRALQVADRIAAACDCSSPSGECRIEPDNADFVHLKAMLTAYLIGAAKGAAGTRGAALERTVTVVTRAVEKMIPAFTPALKNHRAVSAENWFEGGTLKVLVEQLRRAIAEWEASRAPLNWAAINNMLGILLAELAEREREALHLEEAVEVLRQAVDVWRKNQSLFADHDLSALVHNLATAELLLGRRRCKPTDIEAATRDFDDAIQMRGQSGGGIQIGSAGPQTPGAIMDLAASYALRGQAHATLAVWYGDDREAEKAAADFTVAIAAFQETIGTNEFAAFNLAVAHSYAGNFALHRANPQVALDHFAQARRTFEQSQNDKSGAKHSAALRLALASLHAAAAALVRSTQCSLASCTDVPDDLRRKALESLQRANKLLQDLSKKRKDVKPIMPAMHWAKGLALIIEAEYCLCAAVRTPSLGNKALCKATRGAQRCEYGLRALRHLAPSVRNRWGSPTVAEEKRQEHLEDIDFAAWFAAPETIDCADCPQDPKLHSTEAGRLTTA